MAFKIGTTFDDKIYGTSDIDYIWGFGGNDTIIDEGGSGDYVYAGDGNDVVYGDDGIEHLFGDGDNDWLWGFGGNDYLYGGYGNDHLSGGTGRDELWGGPGHDTFCFQWWDSDPSNPDHIVDFEAGIPRSFGVGDTINVTGPAGTASNYDELTMESGAGYNAARNFAENYFAADSYIGGDLSYLFITDGVNGYFFSDADSNGIMENGIVLEGLNSLSDFSYKNIVDIC